MFLQKLFIIFTVYEIKLGTLEDDAVADVEWSLRPYTNTAKKQCFLSPDPM